MSKTIQEIHDSYTALQKTVDHVDRQFASIRQALGDGAFDRCVFLGSGSSFSLAKSMAVTARVAFGGAACAMAAGDVALHARAYKKVCDNALLVLLSRSGETSELGLALDALQQSGARFRVLGIYCAEHTSLAKRAAVNIEMPWAYDRSVCQTRSVTNLYAAGAYLLARYAGRDDWAASIRAAIAGGDGFMVQVEPILALVAKTEFDHVVVLGDGEIGGLCEEGSLAFKEICQLPSNHYHLLDSRHGPFVLFGEKTLVILALSGDEAQLEAALVRDVVAKACTTVTYADMPFRIDATTNLSFGAELACVARGIPFILICQLLSYYKSLERGTDADNPDGLAACIIL